MGLALSKGQIFAGDYRIDRLLGEGGMGSVYVATQVSTMAPRALKLMHVHLAIDATLRRRFEQEARVSARIKSDHVVQVLAAGIDEETRTPWLAMELLEGETLAALAERAGPLPPAHVGEIFLQLCHALAAAHAVGVVHRDLKPENVFIAASQSPTVPFSVKVLDFGVAKILAEAITKSTEPLGTPLWMSPEQTQHDQPVTPASDVWALGLIAFTLLVGRPYWRGLGQGTNPVQLLRQIAIDPLPSATERAKELGAAHLLPEGFDAWFSKTVARDPAARFQSAGEAQAELSRILSGPPGVAAQTVPQVSVAPPRKREPTPFELDRTGVPSSSEPALPEAAPSRPRVPFYAVAAGGVVLLALVGAGVRFRLRPAAHPPRAVAPPAVAPPAVTAPSAPRPVETPAADLSAVPPPASARAPLPPRPTSSAASSARPAKDADLPSFDVPTAQRIVDFRKPQAMHCVHDAPAAVGGMVMFSAKTGRVTAITVTGANIVVQDCVKGSLWGLGLYPFAGQDQGVAFSWLLTPP